MDDDTDEDGENVLLWDGRNFVGNESKDDDMNVNARGIAN